MPPSAFEVDERVEIREEVTITSPPESKFPKPVVFGAIGVVVLVVIIVLVCCFTGGSPAATEGAAAKATITTTLVKAPESATTVADKGGEDDKPVATTVAKTVATTAGSSDTEKDSTTGGNPNPDEEAETKFCEKVETYKEGDVSATACRGSKAACFSLTEDHKWQCYAKADDPLLKTCTDIVDTDTEKKYDGACVYENPLPTLAPADPDEPEIEDITPDQIKNCVEIATYLKGEQSATRCEGNAAACYSETEGIQWSCYPKAMDKRLLGCKRINVPDGSKKYDGACTFKAQTTPDEPVVVKECEKIDSYVQASDATACEKNAAACYSETKNNAWQCYRDEDDARLQTCQTLEGPEGSKYDGTCKYTGFQPKPAEGNDEKCDALCAFIGSCKFFPSINDDSGFTEEEGQAFCADKCEQDHGTFCTGKASKPEEPAMEACEEIATYKEGDISGTLCRGSKAACYSLTDDHKWQCYENKDDPKLEICKTISDAQTQEKYAGACVYKNPLPVEDDEPTNPETTTPTPTTTEKKEEVDQTPQVCENVASYKAGDVSASLCRGSKAACFSSTHDKWQCYEKVDNPLLKTCKTIKDEQGINYDGSCVYENPLPVEDDEPTNPDEEVATPTTTKPTDDVVYDVVSV
jgi:hypothetical protein